MVEKRIGNDAVDKYVEKACDVIAEQHGDKGWYGCISDSGCNNNIYNRDREEVVLAKHGEGDDYHLVVNDIDAEAPIEKLGEDIEKKFGRAVIIELNYEGAEKEE